MRIRLSAIGAALTFALGAIVAAPSGAQRNMPVIAVGNIQSSYENWDVATVQTALESALSKTRKFVIMERGRLDELLQERGLSVAGIADGNASLGGFSGVDYLLYGRVMDASMAGSWMQACRGRTSLSRPSAKPR